MKDQRTCKVCIIGLGPAGIGAALTFSHSGEAQNVICLDAGNGPTERSCRVLNNQACDKEAFCQITSGFGGAALLSGGKVSNYPAGNGLVKIYGSAEHAENALACALKVVSKYVPLQKPTSAVASVEVEKALFENLGFDYNYYDAYLCRQTDLQQAFVKILADLKAHGVSILLRSELLRVRRVGNRLSLTVRQGERRLTLSTEYLILAVGRSGRRMLRRINSELGLRGEENSLDIGVRLEFPTELFKDRVKCHNDLKLKFGPARTFCVCKDGRIIHYFNDGLFLTEGCCTFAEETGRTNLGVTVRLPPSKRNQSICDDLFSKTHGKIVSQSLEEYLAPGSHLGASLTLSDSSSGNVHMCFPEQVSGSVRDAVSYFATRFFPRSRWSEVEVFAPELDYGGLSFPVATDFSVSAQIYIVGDCTGKFRGILQSFSSGISCAKKIGDHFERRTT